jgi:hypothetical protein
MGHANCARRVRRLLLSRDIQPLMNIHEQVCLLDFPKKADDSEDELLLIAYYLSRNARWKCRKKVGS